MNETRVPSVKLTIEQGDLPPVWFELKDTVVRYEPYFDPGDTQAKHILHLAGPIVRIGKPDAPVPVSDVLPSGPEEGSSGMYEIYEKWKSCTACGLHKLRRSVVFGSGNSINPKVIIIGEAPGPEEDVQGIPFIGKTGQRLRRILTKVGLSADEDCFVTNTVLCFPTLDGSKFRAPATEEMLTCRPRLNEQFMHILQTGSLKAVLLLGKRAFATFFMYQQMVEGKLAQEKDYDTIKMKSMLGWYPGQLPWPGVKVMVTWHPSYIERQGVSDSSVLATEWEQDLRALADYALRDQSWDPRPIK